MEKTLLEMTQDILASMGSDEVNSISDTTESMDVARIIKDCYETLIVEINPKREKIFFHLDSSGQHRSDEDIRLQESRNNLIHPTVMFLPSNVRGIEFIKYNIGDTIECPNFKEILYVEPFDFININNNLTDNCPREKDTDCLDDTPRGEPLPMDFNQCQYDLRSKRDLKGRSQDDGVFNPWLNVPYTRSRLGGGVNYGEITFNSGLFQFKYRNDKMPDYYTCPDDNTIIFDSFDINIEECLTSSRTYGYGWHSPKFLMEDSYIPRLNPTHFPLLFNMAKSQAFIENKQLENASAISRERRLKILAKSTIDSTDPRPEILKRLGYGRKSPVVGPYRRKY